MIFNKFEKKDGLLLSYLFKIGNGLFLRSRNPPDSSILSASGSWFSTVSTILLIRLIYSHRSGDLPRIPSIFFAVGAKRKGSWYFTQENYL